MNNEGGWSMNSAQVQDSRIAELPPSSHAHARKLVQHNLLLELPRKTLKQWVGIKSDACAEATAQP
eukprot:6184637-Pleurochrysis_carterae.AAC.5